MSGEPLRARSLRGAALAVTAAVLVWSRVAQVGVGFWNDEAYSAWNYIDPGPREIFYGPYLPNNHVLFSLLAWATTSALGRSEPIYRLWSVAPGIAGVLVLAVWAERRLGAWVGVLFAALATTSALHLELVPQARGYGLAFLAAALLPVAAARIADGDGAARRTGLALLAVAGVVGTWTLPVFSLPFGIQATVLAADRGRLVPVAVVAALVGAACLAFFAPLLGQILAARGQAFGEALTWADAVTGPCRDLACWRSPIVAVSTGKPLVVAGLWALLLLGAARLVRTGDRVLLASFALPVVGTYAALAALRVGVVPRFVSYLLFDVLLLLALGLVEGLWLLRGVAWVRAAAAAALAGIAAIVLGRTARTAAAWSVLPIEAYREAVGVAAGTGIPEVLSNARLYGLGFIYYAYPQVIDFPDQRELETDLCAAPAPFVYIDYPLYGEPVDLDCLRGRGATAVRIPQRAGGPEGWMSVYVLAR